MVEHGTLTVVSPIRRGGNLQELRERLAVLDRAALAHSEGSPVESAFPFWKVSGLHHARIALFSDAPGRRDQGRTRLLLSTQYDGRQDAHLDELIRVGGPALLEIYSFCDRFDAEAGPDDVRLRNYLRHHALRANTFYVGVRGRNVGRIGWEGVVAEWIRKHAIDLHAVDENLDPTDAWHRIRHHVFERLDTKEGGDLIAKYGAAAAEPVGYRRRARRAARRWRRLLSIAGIAVPLLLLYFFVRIPATILLPLAAVAAALWLRVLEEQDAEALARERDSTSDATRRRDAALREPGLVRHEERWLISPLTSVSIVKDSALRRRILSAVLWAIHLRGRYKFARGLLAGIPTIRFAHWLVFDRGRRLLFVSNYDGPWSAYLDDFVEHAAKALTAIWCNTEGFPMTRFLVFAGAKDGESFKAWARREQIPNEVWYSAYPNLSVEEINRNTELVEGLYDRSFGKAQNRERILAWLGERAH